MPKIGPDKKKIEKIRMILRKNPKGLWIREISRLTDLDKSTVSIYLSKYMKNEIEDVVKIRGQLIKLVKLK